MRARLYHTGDYAPTGIIQKFMNFYYLCPGAVPGHNFAYQYQGTSTIPVYICTVQICTIPVYICTVSWLLCDIRARLYHTGPAADPWQAPNTQKGIHCSSGVQPAYEDSPECESRALHTAPDPGSPQQQLLRAH